MTTLLQTAPLSTQSKAEILTDAMVKGGENLVRFVAKAMGSGPCPKCDYVINHCKCKR